MAALAAHSSDPYTVEHHGCAAEDPNLRLTYEQRVLIPYLLETVNGAERPVTRSDAGGR